MSDYDFGIPKDIHKALHGLLFDAFHNTDFTLAIARTGSDSWRLKLDRKGHGTYGYHGSFKGCIDWCISFRSAPPAQLPPPWDHDADTLSKICGVPGGIPQEETDAMFQTLGTLGKLSKVAEFLIDNGDTPVVRAFLLHLIRNFFQGVSDEKEQCKPNA